MTIVLFIKSLICFGNNKQKISLFEPPTAQLDQKQYLRFCGMTLSKMQTIVVTVIAGFVNEIANMPRAKITFI